MFSWLTKQTPPPTKPVEVVVIGGAVTGLIVAQGLVSALPAAWVHVTVIERQDERMVNFGAVRATVNPAFADTIFVPYDKVFKDSAAGCVVHGNVVRVEARQVVVADKAADGGERVIPFDYLVVASGAKYIAPFLNTGEAPASEVKATFRKWHDDIRGAENVHVVGGGALGCELAAEIAYAFRDDVGAGKKKVTLIASGDALSFGKATPALSVRIAEKLKKIGVTILYNEPIELPTPLAHKIGKHTLRSKGDKEIPSDLTMFSIGGSGFNSEFLASLDKGSLLNDRKEVKVKNTLQVDHPEFSAYMFSLGDVAATGASKTVMPAKSQAAIVIKNLVKLIKDDKTPLLEFKVDAKETIGVTVGPNDGAAEFPPVPTIMADFLIRTLKSGDFFRNNIRKDHNLPPV